MMDMQTFLNRKTKLLADRRVPAAFAAANCERCHFMWITDCSVDAVLRIRNSPHVLEMTNDNGPISPAAHREFLDTYADSPRMDFMIVADETGNCIGGVNLCWRERGLEIGKYVGDPLYLGRGIAKAAMLSYLGFLRQEFPAAELLARTRKGNQRNIALNLKLGFLPREDLEGDFLLMHMRLN